MVCLFFKGLMGGLMWFPTSCTKKILVIIRGAVKICDLHWMSARLSKIGNFFHCETAFLGVINPPGHVGQKSWLQVIFDHIHVRPSWFTIHVIAKAKPTFWTIHNAQETVHLQGTVENHIRPPKTISKPCRKRAHAARVHTSPYQSSQDH